jgi:hypothetical protein
LGYDGVREPRYPPLPPVALITHEHTCPDGTDVACRSQWISVVERTVDRWFVAGLEIATSARLQRPEVRPDFGWLDQLARLTA